MLIVVDMQNGFMTQACQFIIPTIKNIISHFYLSHFPIVFTKFINPKINSPFREVMKWDKLTDEPEIGFIPELKSELLKATVIIKYIYTPFGKEFKQLLKQQQTKCIYICGVDTDSCILKTAIDSFEYGLKPIVITDACYSGGGSTAHEAGLLVLSKNIGHQQLQESSYILNK